LRLGVEKIISRQTPLPMESSKIHVAQNLKYGFLTQRLADHQGSQVRRWGMKWKSGFQQRRRSANKAGKPAPINQKIAGSGTG
jgi:hypothetical protein